MSGSKGHALLATVALLGLGACSGDPERGDLGSGGFASGAAIAFEHDTGYAGEYYFPETMGSGVALFDANDDGHLDAYFVQGGPIPGSRDRRPRPTNALWLNDGEANFTEATARIGAAAHPGYGMGVAVADVNGDGAEDLFLTNVGPDALLLAAGDGSLRFDEATPAALADRDWNTACGFADVDRDGHLDLAVVGYVRWSAADRPDCGGGALRDYCSVELYDGLGDQLYRGDGRGGFEEISAAWGFGRVPARGLGLAFADLDEDGYQDAYVANDTDANRVYINDRGLRFLDRTDISGASASADGAHEAGMGIAVCDVDQNALPDLVVTNFAAEPNSVYVNLGQARFRERSRPMGVASPSMSRLAFGVNAMDVDGDGREDLFSACGHVLRHVDQDGTTFTWKQSDQLLLAGPDGRFTAHPGGPPLESPTVGRGSAMGDLDGDGWADLVISNSDGAPTVALNRFDHSKSRPLVVSLANELGSNTAGIGARISITLDDGSNQQRWIRSGTSYLSQDTHDAHFAVPTGSEVLEVTVTWADGQVERFGPTEAERLDLLRSASND